MDNEQLISDFYSAFQKKDADTMVSFYHHNIQFQDPAFGVLAGDRAKAMWQMLCSNPQEIKIEYGNIESAGNSVTAEWQAYYVFSKTGRKVHNVIKAHFELQDGKITRHTDEFNLWKWSTQAMGIKGFLLGGTSFFRNKLQEQTKRLLDKYIQNQS